MIRMRNTIGKSTGNWVCEMVSTSEEIFRDNYLPAWWYAYGKSDQDMRIATGFANHYATARMDNAKGPTGIPECFQKWSESR